MTANHRPIVIEAAMRTPLSMTDPIHFDGILLAAREKRFGAASRGKPLDCVAFADGFHRCSASFVASDALGGAGQLRTTRIARLDMKSRDGELFEPPAGTEAKPKNRREDLIDGNSPYRNVLRDFDYVTGARSVFWQVLGDPDAVLDLLDEIGCIGRMHGTGWGQIETWSFHESSADPAECGAVAHGSPVRNVPAAIAAKFGLDGIDSYLGRIEPPYAGRFDLVPVLAPSKSALTGTTASARTAFGFGG